MRKFFEVFSDRPIVEIVGLSLDYLDSAARTVSYAVSQAVAVPLIRQLHFAVHDFQRAFPALRDALPATVAFVFMYPDDLSECHEYCLLHAFRRG
jgi:hypothetical protein